MPKHDLSSLSSHDESNFWNKVQKTDGCWEWIASKDRRGYGQFNVTRNYVQKMFRAHRVAYFFVKKQDPGRLMLCHTCDNPPCVNPDHMFLGIGRDNVYDKQGKNRAAKKYSREQIEDMRQQYREGKTQREISEQYGSGKAYIGAIVRGEVWAHVPRLS